MVIIVIVIGHTLAHIRCVFAEYDDDDAYSDDDDDGPGRSLSVILNDDLIFGCDSCL